LEDASEQDQALTLPPDLVQEINDDFVLDYSHTIEMFADGVCELVLALPPLLLVPGHRR
jgi:hypothetical protein